MASAQASDWVRRWSHLVPAGTRVLDLACGYGRHMQWFAERGHPVLGVDRAADALQAAAALGEVLQSDLESAPWPLAGRQFGAVVVCNYLWRALFGHIVQSVAPGGVLLYETFAQGNESVGKPANPDFLLRPGELLHAFSDLHVVAYEDGFLNHPARYVQRIAAVRPLTDASTAARWPLGAAL
jgi:SAM-dependent methyltransferase